MLFLRGTELRLLTLSVMHPIHAERIEQLIAECLAARQAKDFARVDAIRKALADAGVILEDSPQGTTWRRA